MSRWEGEPVGSSVGDVAAELNQAVQQLEGCRRTLAIAGDACQDARAGLAAAASGSGNALASAAVDAMTAAIDGLDDVRATLAAGASAIREYVLEITGGLGPSPVTGRPATATGRSRRPDAPRPADPAAGSATAVPTAGLAQAVARVARRLPARTQRGSPTRGFVLDEAGNTLDEDPVVSGTDRSLLDDLALVGPERRASSQLTDVESKVAARIRRGQLPARVVLVLNNTPCAGPLGCQRMLPKVLPNGARVSVYVADGTCTELYGIYDGNGSRIKT